MLRGQNRKICPFLSQSIKNQKLHYISKNQPSKSIRRGDVGFSLFLPQKCCSSSISLPNLARKLNIQKSFLNLYYNFNSLVLFKFKKLGGQPKKPIFGSCEGCNKDEKTKPLKAHMRHLLNARTKFQPFFQVFFTIK